MASMMRCRDAVERLWAYLDDDLEQADHEAVEEHLRFCLRCCGEVEFAKRLRGVLSEPSRPALPTDVRERLDGFIDQLESPTSDA